MNASGVGLSDADIANARGISLAESGNLAAAIAQFHEAIRINPVLSDAYNNIALVYAMLADAERAILYAQKAISLNPCFAKAHNNLGNGLLLSGKPVEAVAAFRQALRYDPSLVSANRNLALALFRTNRFDAARAQATATLKLSPDNRDAKITLADSLMKLHKFQEAYEVLQALHQALGPRDFSVMVSMGHCALELRKFDDARKAFSAAVKVNPDDVEAEAGLMMCELDGATPAMVRSIYLDILDKLREKPLAQSLFSRVLFLNLTIPDLKPEENFVDLRRYSDWFERPLLPWKPHQNSPEPNRRIRLGYVSGDFFAHSVTKFFYPILAHHSRSEVEVFLFSNREYTDEVTLAVQAKADHWIDCVELSDDEFADKIRELEIDILVDLSGHSAENRLGVFIRKPAPIQATWIGVAGSTGLTSMDYRLTDPIMDPAGMTDRWHTEKLIRIWPPMSLVVGPPTEAASISSANLPVPRHFAFASLNQLYKLNARVMRAWAAILKESQGAKLFICNVNSESDRAMVEGLMEPHGMDPSRVVFLPTVSLETFNEFLGTVDLALDAFPYNGGTTTVVALWMGVATLTLAGKTSISRVGAAIALGLELNDFVVETEDAYIATACRVAADPEAYLPKKSSIRTRMETGHSKAPARISDALMKFYREAWSAWCRGTQVNTSITYESLDESSPRPAQAT